jgi:hypothetical protein
MPHTVPKGSSAAVQRGHEIFDLDLTYVRWFSLVIVALVIVTAAVAFKMMGGFRIVHPVTGTAAVDGSPSGPFATLQSAPQQDLRSYRRQKALSLDSYQWVDRSAGVVQIPIERAMELMAAQPERGRTR